MPRSVRPGAGHEVAYQELVTLLRRHPSVTPVELLAIAANMVGKIVAMQDQRRTTLEEAMAIVSLNLEEGNQQVVRGLSNVEGHG